MQRRFQKIVEEAPSPALDEAERRRICDIAVGIARAAGYRNAGTIEFIYGSGEFYFLEMNTRLQVEHPVTEMVTGIDLVAEQLRRRRRRNASLHASRRCGSTAMPSNIASMPKARRAGLCRPPAGSSRWRWPDGPGVRVDCGVAKGQTVTAAFDPMLAKLIVHGRDREEATHARL